MNKYVNKTPMVAIIPPTSQKERIDTFFYHCIFADLDEKLDQAAKELVQVERASLFITDGTHQTPTYAEKENGILFLSSTNIKDDGIDLTECKYITSDLHKKLTNCQPQPGDVLIAKSGTVGTACVLGEDLPECSVYESVAIFRPKEEWNSDYIAAFINSDLGRRQVLRSQKGIAIKHLHLGDLKELWIPKVESNDQKKLIDRLNYIKTICIKLKTECNMLRLNDYKITRNKLDSVFARELDIPHFLEIEHQLCFLRHEKFIERLDIPANHPNYTRLVDQIKTSHYFGVLSDLVNVSEKRFNPEDNLGEHVNYLAIGDIDGIAGKIINPQIMLSDELPSRARRLVYEGDILIGIAGASTGTDNMVVFPVTNEQSGWVATTGFCVLNPKKDVDINYVCTLLKSPFVLRQIRALLISPAMPTISELDLLAIMVPVTNSEIRDKTLFEIENIISDSLIQIRQLDDLCNRIDEILSEVKSNIFDLLDDEKFSVISSRVDDIRGAMTQKEEVLQ